MPVGLLADVLEVENRAGEVGRVGRADEAQEAGHVAAEQAAPRASGHFAADGVACAGFAREEAGFADGIDEGAAQRGFVAGLEGLVRVGAVVGDESRLHEQRVVQRGDVAVAEERLGVGADGGVIEQRQEAAGAVAAAQGEDGFHFRVGEESVQIGRAFGVAAGEVAGATAEVCACFHAEALADQMRDDFVDALRLRGGAGGRGEADEVTGREARRDEERGHGTLIFPSVILSLSKDQFCFGHA
jgi:hypothetical protein